jgi:ribonuclease HII
MYVVGVDEVGRGSGAGPILAAAVVLDTLAPPDFYRVRDSKKLSKKAREEAYRVILHSPHLVDFGIGWRTHEEIEEKGITWANLQVFRDALDDLMVTLSVEDVVYIDGDLRLPPLTPQVHYLAKADDLIPACSAASILAKVLRDAYMVELSEQYPGYDWAKNVGYLGPKHLEGIAQKGLTPFHRVSFLKRWL